MTMIIQIFHSSIGQPLLGHRAAGKRVMKFLDAGERPTGKRLWRSAWSSDLGQLSQGRYPARWTCTLQTIAGATATTTPRPCQTLSTMRTCTVMTVR